MWAFLARFACAPSGTPPYTDAILSPFLGASASSSSVTWAASSRVGTSTSAEGRRSSVTVRSTIGRAKASVFPDPVGDLASTSSPASASGSTSA
jgi:hypothetical protein